MGNSEEEADEMLQDATLGTQSPQSDLFETKLREMVESNPIDFDTWIMLITEIENVEPNSIKRITQVYDHFLSEFPLCYAYWSKYASHMARLCTLQEVQDIYERAAGALAYSVDHWVNYCSFAIKCYEDPADVRRLFKRALSFVGKDYLCDHLWDKYIEFEYSQKQWTHLAPIYINILRFPTRNLKNYYESFKKLHSIWEEMGCLESDDVTAEDVPTCEAENVKYYKYAELSDIVGNLINGEDAHPDSNMLKQYLSAGEQLYHKSTQIDGNIKCFEACIRRPYFHVEPLDCSQLDNWHKYLDFVEQQGDFDWTVKLYERCLIACANYSEFWIRYVEFVDAKGGRAIANNALKRASTVFLKKNPTFHVYYTMYKEQVGDISSARASFPQCSCDSMIDLTENVNRQANMEKRMGNNEAAFLIYEKAIEVATENDDSNALSILYSNFAQFTLVVTGRIDAAREVFVKGVQQKPCKLMIEGLMQFLTMHGDARRLPEVDALMANLISPGTDLSRSLSSNDREDISRLFLKLVDQYGTIHDIRKAWDRHWKLFPHVMRPSVNYTTTGKGTFDNIAELKAAMLATSFHLVNGENSHDEQDTHTERSFLGNITSTMPEGVLTLPSQAKEIRSDATGMLAHVETASEMQPHSVVEDIELKKETCDNIKPSSDNLSINYPEVDTQKTKLTGSPDRTAPLVDSRSNGAFKDSMSRSSGPQVKVEKDFSPMHSASGQSSLESQKGSVVQKSSNDENSAGTHYSVLAQEDYHHRSHSSVQSPQPQEKQVAAAHVQYTPAVTNSQMPTNQSYPCQSPTANVQQGQQANQVQVPYQMTAAQVYPVSNIAWPGQNMMQQGFVYAQAQPSTQSATLSPALQVYQYVLPGNEQYGYLQNGQGFPPHIWQYYQQQLYYLQQVQLQQQQNQQANSTQQQLQIEQLQQMQNLQLQQQLQLQNQQQTLVMQQQNQHHVSQQEAQHSSQQEKHEQLQQTSPYQQQNQQMSHEQQLLYLQQQQLYIHQQQLLLQQQQQQSLQQQQHPQNQQQQAPQQQQTLQEQQMHQMQQQSSSSDRHYLQHAVHIQHYSANQLAQQYGQQAVTSQSSQGEGSKSPNAEQSASPSNSRHQQTPSSQ
ncbi:pre-mRNA-processing factor 39 protein [Dioscorea alata]|uniref:Pre-mRNA-processing factor 39 protein n=1 Tax=Dioscorea alata TaxID=55571 RepID=A0ACB7TQ53_DIOAL|nr:pre-mRNA-processing factor 39 protein [Dioscorea alata]